ncbi:fasciclin domain-containing protein [Parapedobacter deserti]|uniref:Fasciclin domain-containing protein n=1 Tax=Parapedobacter deserti TaxID=1912957 RepID=A0ABV7JIK0_9SPHI
MKNSCLTYLFKLTRTLGIILVALTFFLSCNKKEFMPPQEGEAVAFVDTTLTVQAYMAEDTEHSLFWRAWRRSGIVSQLHALNPDYRFTVFLPSNAAMQEAGLDVSWISRASQQQLDSVVQYHVIPIQITPESFAAQTLYTGTIGLETMRLERDYVKTVHRQSANNDVPMNFRYKVSLINGKVRINNQNVGEAIQCKLLKGGTVFPINRVLQKPRKSTRQVLVEDGRFSLFLGIRRYNDSLYNVLANGEASKTISVPYESNQYVAGVRLWFSFYRWEASYVAPMLNYLSDIHYQYDHMSGAFLSVKQIFPLTVLIPTDEAFHRAGFQTLDDLIAFNHRVPLAESYDGIARCLPTDSILNYHFMGANTRATPNLIFSKNRNQYISGAIVPQPPLIYYANELRNEWIGNLMVDQHMLRIDIGSSHELHAGVPPLDFIRDGEEAVQVRVKGSEYEPATLIEKDIETYTGVIHVLDRLLVPPGFKLN